LYFRLPIFSIDTFVGPNVYFLTLAHIENLQSRETECKRGTTLDILRTYNASPMLKAVTSFLNGEKMSIECDWL
jgi:hypothetical protein